MQDPFKSILYERTDRLQVLIRVGARALCFQSAGNGATILIFPRKGSDLALVSTR